MDHGRFSLAVLVPVVLVLSPPCPAQPSNVTIIGDGEVGGLEWDAVDERWKCVFQFRAEGIPPQTVCDLNFEWSFDGCGASPEISNEQEPVVRFSMTGVCQITMRAWLTGEVCESEGWTASATYYVIGGPFTVSLVFEKANWSHDHQEPDLPWYLTYHGWDPAAVPWPEHLQQPVKAVVTADFDQPEGTTFTWYYPEALLLMVNGQHNGSASCRTAYFYAREGSTTGGMEVALHYTLISNGLPYVYPDDTASWRGPNYVRFTSHKPTSTVFYQWYGYCSPGPPRNPGPYAVEHFYSYRLTDQFGHGMPDTWINERFADPIPPGMETGTLTNYWTSQAAPNNHPLLGVFNKWDRIASGQHWNWVPAPTEPPLWGPWGQEYWAGSKEVEYGAPGGCLVGVRTIKMWSNNTSHAPPNWP